MLYLHYKKLINVLNITKLIYIYPLYNYKGDNMSRYILYKDNDSFALHKITPQLFNKLLLNSVHANSGVYTDEREKDSKFIVMPEFTLNQIKEYISLYEDDNDNLKEYSELLAVIAYTQSFSFNILNKIRNKLDRILHSQTQYWQELYNCNLLEYK